MNPSFDYSFIFELLRRRSAVVLGPDKAYLVESRLAPLLREGGGNTLEDLIGRMRREPDGALSTRVVEALLTHETSFFRDPRVFDALRDHVLPALIRERRAHRRLMFWCAACSTGQEPLSLAMVLADLLPESSGWDVKILASDLSALALERARQGWFTELEMRRGLDPRLRDRFFSRLDGGFQAKPELMARLIFSPINLVAAWPQVTSVDLVLLRNVLIYFDLPTRRQVVQRVRGVMNPGGALLLGSSETLLDLDAGFSVRPPESTGGVVVYQRD